MGSVKSKHSKLQKSVAKSQDNLDHGAAAPPPPVLNKMVLARAIFAYEARGNDDLSFCVNDIMEVMDQSSTWWKCRNRRTNQVGYVPHNYVLIDDGKPTSLDSWFDVKRREADKNLLMMGNPNGTYIIRPSTDTRSYALSIRFQDTTRDMWVVKHYKIRTLDNNGGYYINNRFQFSTIMELLQHYSDVGGLCCPLSIPCPRTYKPPVGFRDIEVNRASIQRIKKLGNGSFGDVWLCNWNSSVEVAVKTLRPNTMDRSKFIKEAEYMHNVYHPRIVQILGVCTQPEDEEVFIITELMNKGALLEFLHSTDGAQLKLNDMIDMLAQIAEGMAFVESKCIIHRDLRAANILVSDNNQVKISDFGLAQVTPEDEDIYRATEGTKFPIKWTAPEAALDRIFSVKSDVWSFGILTYEIITFGRAPYPGMNHRQILDETSRGYRMPNPHGGRINCPPELYELMLQCWAAKPENRPTFKHLSDTLNDWQVATEGQYLHENV